MSCGESSCPSFTEWDCDFLAITAHMLFTGRDPVQYVTSLELKITDYALLIHSFLTYGNCSNI
jgi:hypothetical protein